MRSAGAIRHKISQIRYRHLKKRLEADLRQVPGNCGYNVALPQAGSEAPTSASSGYAICLYGVSDAATWRPTFCDERIDGGRRAKKCDVFCPRRSKEEITLVIAAIPSCGVRKRGLPLKSSAAMSASAHSSLLGML